MWVKHVKLNVLVHKLHIFSQITFSTQQNMIGYLWPTCIYIKKNITA